MGKYRLTKDEEKFFDELKSAYRNPYADNEESAYNKDAIKELEAMKAVLSNIYSAQGRKYAMYKMLTESKNFNDKDLFSNVDKSYWNESNTDNYTPPDVERSLIKKYQQDAKDFWNWKSDKHWTKLPVKELQDKAEKANYSDFGAYLNDVRDVQTDKDRNDLFNDPYGLYTRIVAPRATEAVIRGEDFAPKDLMLDTGENILYSLNPAGRAAKSVAQAPKFAKASKYLGGAVAGAEALSNPIIMELADAAAYGDDSNSERKNFKTSDVLLGGGTNLAMTKIAPSVIRGLFGTPVEATKAVKNIEPPKMNIPMSPENNSKLISQIEDELFKRKIGGSPTEHLEEAYRKLLEDKSLTTQQKQQIGGFLERMLADANKKNVAADYVSNKVGDALSEDPKMQKRFVRMAAKKFGAGPFINMLEDEFADEQRNEDIDKINWLLGDWRE